MFVLAVPAQCFIISAIIGNIGSVVTVGKKCPLYTPLNKNFNAQTKVKLSIYPFV